MISLNLQLESAIEQIKQANPKTILVQLPDGLKTKIPEIKQKLEKNTPAQIYFWLNSCYGACDIPQVDVDLLLHFGHSEWK